MKKKGNADALMFILLFESLYARIVRHTIPMFYYIWTQFIHEISGYIDIFEYNCDSSC